MLDNFDTSVVFQITSLSCLLPKTKNPNKMQEDRSNHHLNKEIKLHMYIFWRGQIPLIGVLLSLTSQFHSCINTRAWSFIIYMDSYGNIQINFSQPN